MMSHRHSFLLAGTVALALVAASGALAADGPPGQGRGEHWAKVDTDGDGAISKAEAEAGAHRAQFRQSRRGRGRAHHA